VGLKPVDYFLLKKPKLYHQNLLSLEEELYLLLKDINKKILYTIKIFLTDKLLEPHHFWDFIERLYPLNF